MLNRTVVTNELYDYLFEVSLHEPSVLKRLRDQTAKMPDAEMQVPAEQGQFLSFLVRLIGAKKTLEVGVFTGYSALWTALALPPDGRMIACDVSEEWTSIARRYWEEAGVADKIDLRLGPATETLARLCEEGHTCTFDFVFLDGDKVNYLEYYERAVQLARPGGLIAVDNVFRSGDVLVPSVQEAGTVVIRKLNQIIRDDRRVFSCMLPVADGLTLAIKQG